MGIFTLSFAFGIKENPGTALEYTVVENSHYWVDDVNSKFYNTFVNTDTRINTESIDGSKKVESPDWFSAEHLIDFKIPYAYSIPIDYNLDCIPNVGSAIFLHCSSGGYTAGCVSVPEPEMIFILNHIAKGCVILIDNADKIHTY